jgi:hypothetical protein
MRHRCSRSSEEQALCHRPAGAESRGPPRRKRMNSLPESRSGTIGGRALLRRSPSRCPADRAILAARRPGAVTRMRGAGRDLQ